jgi:cytoskeletal protein RodZ
MSFYAYNSGMHKNHKGFTSLEALLFLVIIGIVSFAGWYIWQAKNNVTETASTTPTHKSPGAKSTTQQTTITISSKDTGQPLSNDDVEFQSTNGLNCATSVDVKCPNNLKTWIGKTNNEGSITINSRLIQKENEIARKQYVIGGNSQIYVPIAHFDQAGATAPEDSVTIKLIK